MRWRWQRGGGSSQRQCWIDIYCSYSRMNLALLLPWKRPFVLMQGGWVRDRKRKNRVWFAVLSVRSERWKCFQTLFKPSLPTSRMEAVLWRINLAETTIDRAQVRHRCQMQIPPYFSNNCLILNLMSVFVITSPDIVLGSNGSYVDDAMFCFQGFGFMLWVKVDWNCQFKRGFSNHWAIFFGWTYLWHSTSSDVTDLAKLDDITFLWSRIWVCC